MSTSLLNDGTEVYQPPEYSPDPEFTAEIPLVVPAEPFKNRQKWLRNEPGGTLAYRRQQRHWQEPDFSRMTRTEKFAVLGILRIEKETGLEAEVVFRVLKALLVGRAYPYSILPIDPWGRRRSKAHWTPATVPRADKHTGRSKEKRIALSDNLLLDYWLRRGTGRRYWLSTARAYEDANTGEWVTNAVCFDLDDHDEKGHILRRYRALVDSLGPPSYLTSTSTRPEVEIPIGPNDLHGIQFGYELDGPTPLHKIKQFERLVQEILGQIEGASPPSSCNWRTNQLVEVFPISRNKTYRICLGVDGYVLDPSTLEPIADGPPDSLPAVFESMKQWYRHNGDDWPSIETLTQRLASALQVTSDVTTASSPRRRTSRGRRKAPGLAALSRTQTGTRAHRHSGRASSARLPAPPSPGRNGSDGGGSGSWMEMGRDFWEHGLPCEDSRVDYVRAGIFYEFTDPEGAHDEEEMYWKVRDHFAQNHHCYSTLWNKDPREFDHWLRATVKLELKRYNEQGIVPMRGRYTPLFPSRDDIAGMVDLVQHSAGLERRERLPTLRFLYFLCQHAVTKNRGPISAPLEMFIPWKTFLAMPDCTTNSRSSTYVKKRIQWLEDEHLIAIPPKQYKLFGRYDHRCYEYIWKTPLDGEKVEVGLETVLQGLPDMKLDAIFSPYLRRSIRAAERA